MLVHAKSLNPLEIFLMTFVKTGLATPYDLLSRLDVGVGASSPALRRLEGEELLTSTPGPRNRMSFALTKKGEEELQTALAKGPRQYWRHGRRDTYESLRRAIWLGWICSRPEDARQCIAQAGEDLREMAGRNEQNARDLRKSALRLRDGMLKDCDPTDESLMITTVYRWIGAEMDAVQFKLQAEALEVLDSLVRDLPPAPKIWPENSTVKHASTERGRTLRPAKGKIDSSG